MQPSLLRSALAATLLFAAGFSSAKADPMVPTVIVDAATGQVLHSEAATRPWYPASTTKLMTAYVALRAVEQGHIKLETPIVVSPVASKQPPSKIGLKPGQEITLENALKIILVKSANDVSTVIAEGIGGSTAGFSAMMNREAARLGMRESHFVNPHGLHRDDHVSSARDMALLARALLVEFPQYRDLWAIGAVQLGQRKFANTNGLIGRYPGAMGMKTGFVCASGFNLVSAAERNGRTLIAVVFGATTGADRTLKAAQLLDQGFSGGGFSLFGGSSGGMALSALPASFERQAPNRRADICGRRGPPVSEEDSGAAMVLSGGNADRPDMIVGFSARAVPAHGVGQRIGGQISLGPRAELEPTLVYLGRKPGSTELARRAGGESVSPTAQAFAPEPKRAANGNPLALSAPANAGRIAPGRVGQGNAAAPRPAAAASLVTRGQTNAAPAAAKAQAAAAPQPEKAKTSPSSKVDPKKAAGLKKKAEPKKKIGPKKKTEPAA